MLVVRWTSGRCSAATDRQLRATVWSEWRAGAPVVAVAPLPSPLKLLPRASDDVGAGERGVRHQLGVGHVGGEQLGLGEVGRGVPDLGRGRWCRGGRSRRRRARNPSRRGPARCSPPRSAPRRRCAPAPARRTPSRSAPSCRRSRSRSHRRGRGRGRGRDGGLAPQHREHRIGLGLLDESGRNRRESPIFHGSVSNVGPPLESLSPRNACTSWLNAGRSKAVSAVRFGIILSARSGAIIGSSTAFAHRDAAQLLDEVLLAGDPVDVRLRAGITPPPVDEVLEVARPHVRQRRRDHRGGSSRRRASGPDRRAGRGRGTGSRRARSRPRSRCPRTS